VIKVSLKFEVLYLFTLTGGHSILK